MTTPQEPGDQEKFIPPPPPLSESELHGTTGTPAGPVPKEVQLSFWLWVAGAILGVIGGLMVFGERDKMTNEIRNTPESAQLTQEQLDAVVTASLAFTVVLSLVFAGLYLLFAFKARAGRNWARIVLAVLTALSVLSLGLGGSTVISIIGTLVAVAATVLLFLPASNPYFAKK